MKNLISIVEIPTSNFSRAVTFYKKILDTDIEEVEMDGVKMGLFPNQNGEMFVHLIHGSAYKPGSDGVIVYFDGGADLQRMATLIETNGGRMEIPKTEIAPDMGFYAMFIDTEGNKLGLHSLK